MGTNNTKNDNHSCTHCVHMCVWLRARVCIKRRRIRCKSIYIYSLRSHKHLCPMSNLINYINNDYNHFVLYVSFANSTKHTHTRVSCVPSSSSMMGIGHANVFRYVLYSQFINRRTIPNENEKRYEEWAPPPCLCNFCYRPRIIVWLFDIANVQDFRCPQPVKPTMTWCFFSKLQKIYFQILWAYINTLTWIAENNEHFLVPFFPTLLEKRCQQFASEKIGYLHVLWLM